MTRCRTCVHYELDRAASAAGGWAQISYRCAISHERTEPDDCVMFQREVGADEPEDNDGRR